MKANGTFFYRDTMKLSRNTFRNIGISLIVFLVLFGAARDFIFIPLMGKVWGLALMTTPDGFLSYKNLVTSLVQSPWIILIGAVLLVLYAVFAMWQTATILIGVTYTHSGKKIGLGSLIRISLLKLKNGFKGKNWMLLVYSLLILPFANVYQTNDLIGTFIVPEYIQDFIDSRTILWVIFLLLMVSAVYLALRWLFLMPAFILRNKDFRQSRLERRLISSDQWLKNGINLGLYSLVELIRLSIVPIILIMLPVCLCFHFTRELDFSLRDDFSDLFPRGYIRYFVKNLFEIPHVDYRNIQLNEKRFCVFVSFEKCLEKGNHSIFLSVYGRFLICRKQR